MGPCDIHQGESMSTGPRYGTASGIMNMPAVENWSPKLHASVAHAAFSEPVHLCACCDTVMPAMTSYAAAQRGAETRYAADFADPGALPPPALPAGMTPGATTCDLAAGTVRGGRHIPGAAAPCQPL